MKKFVIGFVLGAAIAASTAVAASDSIEAYLFPSRVSIHSGETIQTVDTTGEHAVVNINGKAYIPLRTFAEAMGAKVDYEEGSASGGTEPQIRLKIGEVPDRDQLTVSDPDHYVNMGQFHIARQPNGQFVLASGTIRINKDIKDKKIELKVLNKKGEIRGVSQYVHVDNSELAPPSPGETRSFSTRINMDPGDIGAYQIVVRDVLTAAKYEQIDIHLADGIVAALYPPSGFSGHLPANEIAPFRVSFQNNYKHGIVVEPYEWKLYVHRIDENNNLLERITEKTLPVVTGPLEGLSSYSIPVNWNPVDSEGQPLSPGHYKITLERPGDVSYRVNGGNPVTEPLITNTRTPQGFNFELE